LKAFLWIVTSIFIAFWTISAWVAYAVIDVSGNWASGNADAVTSHPETVETLSWLARVLSGTGEFIVIAVWALGTLMMAAVPWLLGKLIDRARPKPVLQWHPDDPRAAPRNPGSQRIP
jgi:hypothetical protein